MANIIEKARAEHAYNKYVKGLESVAGLVDTLSGPGPFTIFIPTDAAFDSLSDDQQANLFADPGKLAKVLKYHIVPGYYTAELHLFRHGDHRCARKHQDQWWACGSGKRDRGQWHHARHRQGAHPTIHHALNTRSTPLVPGWMALPEPGSNSERTGDCCDVCHFRKLTMLCIGRCISILWETRNSLIAAARERGESLEQPLFVGKDTYFIPHI